MDSQRFGERGSVLVQLDRLNVDRDDGSVKLGGQTAGPQLGVIRRFSQQPETWLIPPCWSTKPSVR